MNRYFIVTGGGAGIGFEMAKFFAQREFRVVIVDKSVTDASLKELSKFGDKLKIILQDITDSDAPTKIFNHIPIKEKDRVVLVNNAGLKSKNDLLSETLVTWNEQLAVMLTAPFYLTQRLIDLAIQKNLSGAVVNIGSIVSKLVSHQSPGYHAAKSGINGITKYLAISAARLGCKIRVNAIEPGLIIQSRHQSVFLSETNSTYRKVAEEYLPAGNVGTDEDIIQAVYWLQDERSEFINGQIIKLDGGASLQEQLTLSQHIVRKMV